MADGVLSPGGAVAGALQDILARRKLESRQAMLDKMAQDAAALQTRDTESQITARQGASQLGMENLGINQQQLAIQREAEKRAQGTQAWEQQKGMEDLALRSGAQTAELRQKADRPLTIIHPGGRIQTDDKTQVPPNQSVVELGWEPKGSGTGGSLTPSLRLPSNYRMRSPEGKEEILSLNVEEVENLKAHGWTSLGVSRATPELMPSPSNQTMGAVRTALLAWENEQNKTRSGFIPSLDKMRGIATKESETEALARQAADVAIAQMTSMAPPQVLGLAQRILASGKYRELTAEQLSQLYKSSGGKEGLDISNMSPDQYQLFDNLLNQLRTYYRLKGPGVAGPSK